MWWVYGCRDGGFFFFVLLSPLFWEIYLNQEINTILVLAHRKSGICTPHIRLIGKNNNKEIAFFNMLHYCFNFDRVK